MRLRQTFTAALMLCGFVSVGRAQHSAGAIQSLAGITRLAVVVEDVPALAETAMGLDPGTLKTEVELQLRLAGVRVVPMEENLDAPWLYVQPSVTTGPEFLRAWMVQVRLFQMVGLQRMPGVSLVAPTWLANGFFGTGSDRTIAEKVRQAVRDEVIEFLNDYLTANPREK